MIIIKYLETRGIQIPKEDYEELFKFWEWIQSQDWEINQTCFETTDTVPKINFGNDHLES